MATRKTPKTRQPEPSSAESLHQILDLVPAAWAHHKDAATGLNNGLSIVRAMMRHQFGIDPKVTKKPQHLDLALGLLTMMLDEARFSRGVVPKTERGAANRARREQARRGKLEELLREHKGTVSEVARAMGKGRNQIVRWIERYGLDPDVYRNG